MEVLESQDDSSGAAPSVKSEDGSPSPEDARASPPPNCAICLGRCRNKSFTDSCLHQFCFKCLVTWSKVKSECPLCKQNFKSIIHNVRSNEQYEEYRVEQRRVEEDRIDIDDLMTATRRFRYRTTLTFPRGRETLALQQLLMHYPLSAMVGSLPGAAPAPLPSLRRRRSPSSFRRTVYRHNLWARPLPDFTGRFRDCTPDFYRYNASQMHRLVPWLNRELHYLLLENAGHIAYVLARILELLPQYHIMSPEFREDMYRFFGSRTDHFLHELQCFASTPYDMTGYDRNVQYTTGDTRISNAIDENVISSSDTDSGDTIVLVSSPPTPPLNLDTAAAAAAGPSAAPRRAPEPVYPRGHIAPRSGVIPIETISHSDTDDDEVVVTGYIKPPQARTPEVVDLLASDSDVVVQEETAPERRTRGSMVQLTVSRSRARAASPASSDSDAASYAPPLAPPRRRRRPRRSSAAPSSPSSPDDSSVDVETMRSTAKRDRSARRKKKYHGKSDSDGRTSSDTAVSGSPASTSPSRSPWTPAPRSPVPGPSHAPTPASPRDGFASPPRDRREKNKRSKLKSRNGKGVKSSRRRDGEVSPRPGSDALASRKRKRDEETNGPGGSYARSERKYSVEASAPDGDRGLERSHDGNPGPSGSAGTKRRYDENPGPSGSGGSKRRHERGPERRHGRETERLKSVVRRASGSAAVAGGSARGERSSSSSRSSRSPAPAPARRVLAASSDSDDDIPLNLTVQRAA